MKQVADAQTLRALDRRVNRGIFAAFAITCAASGTLSLLAEGAWMGGVPVVALGFWAFMLVFFGVTLVWMREG